MSRSRSAVVVALTTGLVLTGGMASAARETAKDKQHDVETATADLQKVKVNNAGQNLSVRVKMARASAGRTHLVVTLTPVPALAAEGEETFAASGVYTVSSVAAEGKGKKFGAILEYTPAGGEASTPECDGIKTTISAGKRGNARFRIPQTCFGEDAGTMKLQVESVDADGDVIDKLAKPVKVEKGKKA